jgi:hypothetical protein
MDKFEKEDPFCELEAHGNAVGLPDGLMGNSEGTPLPPINDSGTFEYWCWQSCLAGSSSGVGELTIGSCANRPVD